MYIKRIKLKNIRSIENFEMTFPKGKEAGWHVLIGNNGAGKSTIVKSIALSLLDYVDIIAARQNWNDWLKKNSKSGSISLELLPQKGHEPLKEGQKFITNSIRFNRADKFNDVVDIDEVTFRDIQTFNKLNIQSTDRKTNKGIGRYERNFSDAWFSAAYGPFRRFTGGDRQKEEALERSNPKLASHISIFGEDTALSSSLNYLRELYIDSLDTNDENSGIAEIILDLISDFINNSEILPYKTKIERVSKDGIFLKDANGYSISILEMSDGYRSVLSLVIDLLRHLMDTYNIHDMYDTYIKDGSIRFPGVVLIDEVDAHLHPTWQIRIGNWFTQYFPNIQFIVTTHSPLICRAAEKGSIWRLADPGSNQQSTMLTKLDQDRLIYGNILDAYGTETFGRDVDRSVESKDKLQRLAHLSQLNSYGKISDLEKKELQNLRKILTTDDTTIY